MPDDDLLWLQECGYSIQASETGDGFDLQRWTWGRMATIGTYESRGEAMKVARRRIDKGE